MASSHLRWSRPQSLRCIQSPIHRLRRSLRKNHHILNQIHFLLGRMSHQLDIEECASFINWPYQIKRLFVEFCASQRNWNSGITSNCKILFRQIYHVRSKLKQS